MTTERSLENYATARERIECGKWRVDPKNGQVFGVNGQPIGHANWKGYVDLKIGNRDRVRAHRVIFEYVHGPILDPELQINHRNGDKTDNRIDNLELVSVLENIRHGIATGLLPQLVKGTLKKKTLRKMAGEGIDPPSRGGTPDPPFFSADHAEG